MVASKVDNHWAIHLGLPLANSIETPFPHWRLRSLLVVILLMVTACAGSGDGSASTASSIAAGNAPPGSEGTTGQGEEPTGESDANSRGGSEAERDDDGLVDLDLLIAAIFDGESDHPDIEAPEWDLPLGGSPDLGAAAAITLGLEAAGADLTDLELSVLPLTGMNASLLVLELTSELEVVASDPEPGDDDNAVLETLLAMPEISETSITDLVFIFRGEDEEGPFVLTLTASISDLQAALASGAGLGDKWLIQLEQGSP